MGHDRVAEVVAACDDFRHLLDAFAAQLEADQGLVPGDTAREVQQVSACVSQLRRRLQAKGGAAEPPAETQALLLPSPRLAADSFTHGLLPNTLEVQQLLQQLDTVNGTIRALDEMMAAASLNLGPSAADCLGALPQGTLARFSASLLGAGSVPLPGPTPATVPGNPLLAPVPEAECALVVVQEEATPPGIPNCPHGLQSDSPVAAPRCPELLPESPVEIARIPPSPPTTSSDAMPLQALVAQSPDLAAAPCSPVEVRGVDPAGSPQKELALIPATGSARLTGSNPVVSAISGRLEDAEDTARIASLLCSPERPRRLSRGSQAINLEPLTDAHPLADAAPAAPEWHLQLVSAEPPSPRRLLQSEVLAPPFLLPPDSELQLIAVPDVAEGQAQVVAAARSNSSADGQTSRRAQSSHWSRGMRRAVTNTMPRGAARYRPPKAAAVARSEVLPPVLPDSDAIELFSQEPFAAPLAALAKESTLEQEQEQERYLRRHQHQQLVLQQLQPGCQEEEAEQHSEKQPGQQNNEQADGCEQREQQKQTLQICPANQRNKENEWSSGRAVKEPASEGLKASGLRSVIDVTDDRSSPFPERAATKQHKPEEPSQQGAQLVLMDSQQLGQQSAGNGADVEASHAGAAKAAPKPKRRSCRVSLSQRLLSQRLVAASQRLRSSRRRPAEEPLRGEPLRKGRRRSTGWVLERPRREPPAVPLLGAEASEPLPLVLMPPAPAVETALVKADATQEPMQIIFTGFSKKDLFRLKPMVEKLGGSAVRELPLGPGAASVRVVTCCEGNRGKPPGRQLAASRTLKYLEAIAAGAWVLSPEWVYKSASAERWLPEEQFELAGDNVGCGGPAKGRRNGPRLFAGMRLYFAASSQAFSGGDKDCPRIVMDEDARGMQPQDLGRLARRAGAEVLESICQLPDLEVDPPHLGRDAKASNARRKRGHDPGALPPFWWRKPIVVRASGAGNGVGAGSRRQRTCQSNKDIAAATSAGWVVMSSQWMLDCFSSGEIRPPASTESGSSLEQRRR